MLRLRSYRSDWKLTDSELAQYEFLLNKVMAQMKETGDSADGWWVAARANEILGHRRGAKHAYEKALSVNPDHAPSLLYRARMLISAALWERFVEQEANDSEMVRGYLREAQDLISRGIARGGLSEIEQDIAKGFELVVRGEPAREFCAHMLRKWKGKDFWEEFHLIRGLAHTEGLYDDATHAIQSRPGFYEAYYHRAGAPGCLTDLERSIRDLDRAIDLNPRYFEAIIGRATMHRLLRRFDAALRDLTRAIDLEPDSAQAVAARAAAYIESGDLLNAQKDLDRSLSMEPENPSALLARSHLRAVQGDLNGALQDIDRVIQLRPRRSEAYSNRGTIRLNLKQYDEAMNDFDKAIELNPHNVQYWIKRGYTKRMKKDLQGAIDDYSRGVEVSPKDPEVHYYRGTAYVLLGKYAQAEADLSKSVDLNPRYPLSVHNLAYVRFLLSEQEKERAVRKKLLKQAIRGFEDAKNLGADRATVEKYSQRARDRLKELGEDY
jgi:tetratricopeptide (TPR) repeat protein